MNKPQTAYEAWRDANEDRLSSLWEQHLSEMQDSWEHIAYLRGSDKCFAEFCEETYEEETGGES